MTRFRKGTVFLGRYVLLGPIGRGSVSVVYEADDTLNGRRVAIKLLEPEYADNGYAWERVLHPAAVMAQLRDPGVPRLYEFGDAPLGDGSSIAYAVMDLLTGEPLDRRLVRGPLPVPDAVSIAATVADLLTLAHAQGIVLGGFGPASILLTSDGAKVVDFDAAGTPPAEPMVDTAPPRSRGWRAGAGSDLPGPAGPSLPAAAADDVYALGALLFELVTGIAPTAGAALAAEVGQPAPLVDLWRRCLTYPAHRPDAATVAFELWGLLTPGAMAGPTFAPYAPAARAAAGPAELETRTSPQARTASRQAESRQAASGQAESRQAELGQAAAGQAAMEQAAREQAALEQAAREQAALEQAAREQAALEQAAREQAAKARGALARAALDRSLRGPKAPAKLSTASIAANLSTSVPAIAEPTQTEQPPTDLAAEVAGWDIAAADLAHRERAAQERAAQERAAQERAAQERAAQERAARERARAERERADWVGLARDGANREHPDRWRGEAPPTNLAGYVGQGGRHRRRRPAWSGTTTSGLPVG